MSSVKTLFKKEAANYLNSSVALIFLGAFLIMTLFSFFIADKFFERNIADLRPLFHWLPVLLIFLVSALTMRSWSEERSQGTLELLLTWPVRLAQLVLGKFFGVLSLVAVALALTFPLPVTVELLGDLDWGPVVGGYLGALLVAGSYTAIGLWISSLTANQIVALFLTGALCCLFYVLGSDVIVNLMPNQVAEVLRALGTGSRFDSIARGVVDLRDVVYYLSLTVFFLTLNAYALADLRRAKPHPFKAVLGVVLLAGNLIALNLWLAPVTALRLDLTARHEYTISPTTKQLLRGLREPLTLKFYSSETHPLLKPLIPQVRDLIKEYEVVSGGKVRGVFIDPTQNEKEEKEANQTYGIKPVPFQVPGRHEMKIVNSYFNILVLYGDQHTVLNFEDLIEINVSDLNDMEVKLRNPEYDLTKSIKKVVYGFQNMEDLFASIPEPIHAQVLITPKTLPKEVHDVPASMAKVYEDLAKRSGGKFTFEMIDLDATDAPLTRDTAQKEYKLKPFAVSPLAPETFFLHTIVKIGGKTEVLYPTGDLSENDIRSAMEGLLKRQTKGFLKTVGLWTPPPAMDMMGQFGGQQPQNEDRFELLQEVLRNDYQVRPVDLHTGFVAKDVDLLMLVKPKALDEAERFAVDQFLMQGGTVIVASGAYEMKPTASGGLGLQPLAGGVDDLLGHYGIGVQKNLVVDLQNDAFPVPVTRDLGGFQVREMQLLRYPFFVDVRQKQMAADQPALSGLPMLTLQWTSALAIDEEKLKAGRIQTLIHSSDKSWIVDGAQGMPDIQPDLTKFPELGFAQPPAFAPQPLVAALQGPIKSFYEGKALPVAEKKKDGTPDKAPERVIDQSPDSARLVVIGSGDFITDTVLNLSRSSGQERFMNNLQFVLNLIDWSLEDIDMMAIRSRGSYARMLLPVSDQLKLTLEIMNYGLVLVSLAGLGLVIRIRRRRVKALDLPYPPENKSGALVQEKAA